MQRKIKEHNDKTDTPSATKTCLLLIHFFFTFFQRSIASLEVAELWQIDNISLQF